MSKYCDSREGISRRARLSHRLKDIEGGLHSINIELCALLPDPSNPDWMPALKRGNPADAECLQSAFNTLQKLLHFFMEA
jgi:hypothetical protein